MDGSSKRKAWEVGASKTGESVPKRGSLEEGRGAAERAVTRPARVRVSLSRGGCRGRAAGGWNVPREQNRASGGPGRTRRRADGRRDRHLREGWEALHALSAENDAFLTRRWCRERPPKRCSVLLKNSVSGFHTENRLPIISHHHAAREPLCVCNLGSTT